MSEVWLRVVSDLRWISRLASALCISLRILLQTILSSSGRMLTSFKIFICYLLFALRVLL